MECWKLGVVIIQKKGNIVELHETICNLTLFCGIYDFDIPFSRQSFFPTELGFFVVLYKILMICKKCEANSIQFSKVSFLVFHLPFSCQGDYVYG